VGFGFSDIHCDSEIISHKDAKSRLIWLFRSVLKTALWNSSSSKVVVPHIFTEGVNGGQNNGGKPIQKACKFIFLLVS
jgi:hypothetical protein